MNKKIIRLSKSSISKAEKNAVLAVLDTEYLGMGIQVREFEDELSNFFSRDVACVVNGTAALHLALLALDIGPGDEVITTAHSWISTSETITQAGANVVFVDIDKDYYTIDTNLIEEKITKKTKRLTELAKI